MLAAFVKEETEANHMAFVYTCLLHPQTCITWSSFQKPALASQFGGLNVYTGITAIHVKYNSHFTLFHTVFNSMWVLFTFIPTVLLVKSIWHFAYRWLLLLSAQI